MKITEERRVQGAVMETRLGTQRLRHNHLKYTFSNYRSL